MGHTNIYTDPVNNITIPYEVNSIEDFLASDKYLKNSLPPNLEQIFNCEKKQANKLAKNLIVDLFQMIKKDMLSCNQFALPLKSPSVMNLYIREVEPKKMKNYFYDPNIDGKAFFPVFEILYPEHLKKNTEKQYAFKPTFSFLLEIKKKVYEGIRYASQPIVKKRIKAKSA